MSSNLQQYSEKFNALELRERILITAAVVALVFMLFDVLLLSDNQKTISSLEQQINITKKRAAERLKLQENANITLLQQRNDPKIVKLKVLENKLNEVRERLINKTLNLVQPHDMASVLREIILSTKSLKLLELKKLKTTELSAQLEEENQQQDSKIKLYRHSMQLVLEGGYQSTYLFLNKLEKMKRRVAFEKFEYKVNKHPNATITLLVSTLSLEKEWIGGL